MKRPIVAVALLALLGIAGGAYVIHELRRAEFWESQIRDYEATDRVHPPLPGSIVFTGSSSIRYWSTLAEDMRPLTVVNRGFGGSQLKDVIFYARRIVTPYRPRAVVVYAGENDLGWPTGTKEPSQVLEDFKHLVTMLRADLPETPVYFISLKPSPLRHRQWEAMQTANRLIQQFALTQVGVKFIDVASAMLDEQGNPRRELYRLDGLHLNRRGYELWASIIRPILQRELAPKGK